MPKTAEVAQLIVDGSIFQDWKSVNVTRTSGQPVGTFEFTASEKTSLGSVTAAAKKIKVGSACQVILAGHKVIDGYVMTRQAGLSADDHAIIVQGASKTFDIVVSSAKPAEFKGYGIDPIIKSLVKPFSGVSFTMQDQDAALDKPLETFRVQYGEFAFEAIERLGRMRGLMFCDDENGNLVGFQLSKSGSGFSGAGGGSALVEGQNILLINSTLSDINVMQKVKAVTQRMGSDKAFAGAISKTAAVATNMSARAGRELYLIAEHTGDTDDAKTRANHEVARQYFSSVEVTVHVQGWLKPDGTLWKETSGYNKGTISVYSPSTFTSDDGKMDLAVKQVTYLQDVPGGTRTVLSMCLPLGLSNTPDVGPQGTVPDLLRQQAAIPDFNFNSMVG